VYSVMKIIRLKEINHIKEFLKSSPGETVLGSRQCDKTILASQFSSQKFYS